MTLACPKCGASEGICVEALVLIQLNADGYAVAQIPQAGHLYEWDGNSDTICGKCGYNAKAEEFGEQSVAHLSDEEAEEDEVEFVKKPPS